MSEALLNALERAERMGRMGAHDAAIEAWRDVLTEDPSLAEAHAGLAYSLVHQRRIVAARAEAGLALEIEAESSDALLVLALCDYFDNRRKRALQRLDELLAIDPVDAEAYGLKAVMLRDAGRWDKAEKAIAKALELSPGNPEHRLEEGRLAQVQGQTERAEQIARDLVAQDPAHVGALVLLGTVQRDKRNIDEAYTLALSALSIDPGDAEALELLAGVKLSRNPIGGLYWHIIRKLRSLGETKILWFAWFLYLGYLLILTTMDWLEVSPALEWVFILLYLAFGVGVWMNRAIVDRMVRRELSGFRWTSDY